MIPYERLLEEVRKKADPFGPAEAKVVISVYHPDSMDEPLMAEHTFSQAELAEASNRKLSDYLMNVFEHRLVEIFSKWRGP